MFSDAHSSSARCRCRDIGRWCSNTWNTRINYFSWKRGCSNNWMVWIIRLITVIITFSPYSLGQRSSLVYFDLCSLKNGCIDSSQRRMTTTHMHTYSSFYSRLLPPQVISSFRWHTVYHLHQALPIQSHVCLCNVGEERRLEASNQCCKYDLHYTGNIFFFYSDVVHVTGYAIVISFAGVLHIGSRLCPTSMCKNYLHQGGMY